MKKLLISVALIALASTTLSVRGSVAADISRMEAEMKHLEAQMHKNAAELAKLREKHAIAKSQAYNENKNSQRKTLADDTKRRVAI
jgi:hypothetical protein